MYSGVYTVLGSARESAAACRRNVCLCSVRSLGGSMCGDCRNHRARLPPFWLQLAFSRLSALLCCSVDCQMKEEVDSSLLYTFLLPSFGSFANAILFARRRERETALPIHHIFLSSTAPNALHFALQFHSTALVVHCCCCCCISQYSWPQELSPIILYIGKDLQEARGQWFSFLHHVPPAPSILVKYFAGGSMRLVNYNCLYRSSYLCTIFLYSTRPPPSCLREYRKRMKILMHICIRGSSWKLDWCIYTYGYCGYDEPEA